MNEKEKQKFPWTIAVPRTMTLRLIASRNIVGSEFRSALDHIGLALLRSCDNYVYVITLLDKKKKVR